ncbi:2-succinyl-5-enolpyruvyl-6-hydroxy-3-cyclohexene-1-carboxylic-acid synthase [Aeromicrobium marinum DSM 15272]|uniref:2-succinyl-5-enolpyruvyl-6-hydroxy-3-cyclohexene-1-carboxylate synthase n=1 Tax=Aeromicrobium marinum DSM 15272 TaxID=585531 RepID=E2SF23_9ACTN|nr:thiamine pyrophosphate-binding protein [Aeromicrobium marinum]EFQ82267.1 2-succinyl-5-enolpyruvyl-6-hydroxy-3-cyclohexene-1-carboxylic-acid synthase [Aeromicrobium marinum DSM 15272]
MTSTRLALDVLGRLLALGVTDAVLAPGSRSGPIALVLHEAERRGQVRLHVRVDEREAGFLALGMAKVSRRPVPVVTTSGTAVANLHPAMLEAQHAGVRLIAVTADRPGRLRGTGANQTTDQRRIFPGIAYAEHAADLKAVAAPQHLNVELDEPLIDTTTGPVPSYPPVAAPSTDRRADRLRSGPRTVVVAGDDSPKAARRIAREGRWPLIAEPSSGARRGDQAMTAGRMLLAHSALADQIQRVVSFGHPTLSREVTALLARPGLEVVHVGGPRTFPTVPGPSVRFVRDVMVDGPGDFGWYADWHEEDRRAIDAIEATLGPDDPQRVAQAVWDAVPPGGLLVVGSSSPIRDLDLVAAPHPASQRRMVLANRGLAGIDGMLSTAIGAALARDSTRNLAYMGDLTFLHGAGGLLAGVAERRPDLTVVVASDDGGSIFSLLEQGAPEYADAFERVYATPTGSSIADLCAAHGVAHHRVAVEGLAPVLAQAPTGIEVVEVPLDRFGRRDLEQRLSGAVRDALA